MAHGVPSAPTTSPSSSSGAPVVTKVENAPRSSARRWTGTIVSAQSCPSTSSRRRPVVRSAARLKAVTVPVTSTATMIAFAPSMSSALNSRSRASARRLAASRSSRWMAGTSRPRWPFAMKSCAPALIAATAVSSPTAPDTMMKGRSKP